MKAVILAAGKGTRMGSLTAETPKPLLEINGKSLLEHKLDLLPDAVDGVVIVVGYFGDRIREKFGDSYNGTPIEYVMQESLNGTAGAVWSARPLLNGRFIVMMGDDLYAKQDMERAAAMEDWSILLQSVEYVGGGGRVVLNDDGSIDSIIEGVHDMPGLINTNMITLDERIFDHPMVPKAEGSNEYGLPQTVIAASKHFAIPLSGIVATEWIQVTDPNDLAASEDRIHFLRNAE